MKKIESIPKTKAKYWADVEEWSQTSDASWDFCLLELRDRVETLETTVTSLRIEHLRLINAVAHLVPDRTKFFVDLMPDSDEPNDLEKPEGSLVERVRNAIAKEHEPIDWCYDEAKTAIREVAAWLSENSGGTRAAWMLEQEAER